jgi:hypothetical protein
MYRRSFCRTSSQREKISLDIPFYGTLDSLLGALRIERGIEATSHSERNRTAISDRGDNSLCFQASGTDYNAGLPAPGCDATSFRVQPVTPYSY